MRTKRRERRLPLLLGGLLALAARAEEIDLGWIDRQALADREIAVQTQPSERGQPTEIKAAALIDASTDAIWRVLTACQDAPEYVSTIVSCELMETLDDGRAQLFRQTVRPVFFLPRFQHVFRLDYHPPDRIDVHRVSGPLDHLEGSWHLLPQPDGQLLLVHELAVDPGAPVPRFLVRARLRRDVQQTLRAVRDRAEAAMPAPP